MPAKAPRFRVERYGGKFAVVDTIDITIQEFSSRQDADRECDTRNGIVRQKTSEPAELQVLREKLRREGFLSSWEFAAMHRPRTKDLTVQRPMNPPPRLTEQFRQAHGIIALAVHAIGDEVDNGGPAIKEALQGAADIVFASINALEPICTPEEVAAHA
jgi:hypothetical protein